MASDNKKAVIVGTSNALMRDGWVNQTRPMAQQSGWDYVNRSIGGSSSLLGAYLLATDEQVRAADRVIIDFCINDQLFIGEGQATLDHVYGHYTSMFTSLDQLDALERAIILMLPQQNVDATLFDSLIALFDRAGVRYIDLRPRIAEWLQVTGRSADEAYSDSAHFAPELQRHIGELVIEDLLKPETPAKADIAFRSWLLKQEPLEIVDLDILSDRSSRCQVGTSVIQYPAHRFRQGDQFHIAGAPLFVAALIWATRESGVLTLRGKENGFRVHLRRDYAGLFIFDSVFQPLALADPARVDVLNDKTVPFQRMRGQKSSIYDDADSTVEIVSLVGASRAPEQLGAVVSARLAPPTARPGFAARIRKFLRPLGLSHRGEEALRR